MVVGVDGSCSTRRIGCCRLCGLRWILPPLPLPVRCALPAAALFLPRSTHAALPQRPPFCWLVYSGGGTLVYVPVCYKLTCCTDIGLGLIVPACRLPGCVGVAVRTRRFLPAARALPPRTRGTSPCLTPPAKLCLPPLPAAHTWLPCHPAAITRCGNVTWRFIPGWLVGLGCGLFVVFVTQLGSPPAASACYTRLRIGLAM
jgi:hypothetical protein